MFRPVNLNRAGTKKTQKSFVFVIIATHHHVAGHSHVSSHFHFVNRSLPTCFSFFFLASSLLRSLFFFNFLASPFFGFSRFEHLVYLVLDARVPLPHEYTEVIKWVKSFQNFQTYLQAPTCLNFNFYTCLPKKKKKMHIDFYFFCFFITAFSKHMYLVLLLNYNSS